MCSVAVDRQYVDSRFGQSHLYRAGPARQSEHPPVMCFHMSPWSAVYYQPLLAELGNDRLAIAVDTPGYGNSDPSPELPEMADYAAAMGDVADGLGLKTLDLIGDRTGAKVALELARQRPRQVRRIIVISLVVWTDEERARRQVFPKEEVREDGSHLVALWRLSEVLSMEGRSLEMLGDIFYARNLQHEIAHWGRRAAANYNETEALMALHKPIMVLRPRDELWPITPRVKPYLQHVESHMLDLPDWGYGFLEVKTLETAAILRKFLDRSVE